MRQRVRHRIPRFPGRRRWKHKPREIAAAFEGSYQPLLYRMYNQALRQEEGPTTGGSEGEAKRNRGRVSRRVDQKAHGKRRLSGRQSSSLYERLLAGRLREEPAGYERDRR
jgi:hypothetical protein